MSSDGPVLPLELITYIIQLSLPIINNSTFGTAASRLSHLAKVDASFCVVASQERRKFLWVRDARKSKEVYRGMKLERLGRIKSAIFGVGGRLREDPDLLAFLPGKEARRNKSLDSLETVQLVNFTLELRDLELLHHVTSLNIRKCYCIWELPQQLSTLLQNLSRLTLDTLAEGISLQVWSTLLQPSQLPNLRHLGIFVKPNHVEHITLPLDLIAPQLESLALSGELPDRPNWKLFTSLTCLTFKKCTIISLNQAVDNLPTSKLATLQLHDVFRTFWNGAQKNVEIDTKVADTLFATVKRLPRFRNLMLVGREMSWERVLDCRSCWYARGKQLRRTLREYAVEVQFEEGYSNARNLEVDEEKFPWIP